MYKLADISVFENLMNGSGLVSSNTVFNDGGEWLPDGWHSYGEVPPVDPDDGWNDLRRTDPEEFIRCGLVSPDDGKNWARLANPDRFRATELVKKRNELAEKQSKYKQQKRRDEIQHEIDKLDAEIEWYIAKGEVPYNIADYSGTASDTDGVPADAKDGIVDVEWEERGDDDVPETPVEPESPEEPEKPENAELEVGR